MVALGARLLGLHKNYGVFFRHFSIYMAINQKINFTNVLNPFENFAILISIATQTTTTSKRGK